MQGRATAWMEKKGMTCGVIEEDEEHEIQQSRLCERYPHFCFAFEGNVYRGVCLFGTYRLWYSKLLCCFSPAYAYREYGWEIA